MDVNPLLMYSQRLMLHFRSMVFLMPPQILNGFEWKSLQDSLLTGSAELDAVLTSTHQSSGQQTVWKDSLFQYVNDFQAYNFWTTSPFSPSETYVLEIMRSDGALTSLTVTLPNVFPSPEFNVFPFSLINLPVSGNVCAREFDFQYRY